jgi:hypothetical protein
MAEGRQTKEGFTRMWATHSALLVRGPRGGPFTLVERYGKKRKLGIYRSVQALKRGIAQHNARARHSHS